LVGLISISIFSEIKSKEEPGKIVSSIVVLLTTSLTPI